MKSSPSALHRTAVIAIRRDRCSEPPRSVGEGSMVRAGWIRWLQAPLATGWQALLCGLFAVWVPTVIRLRLNGVVTGCEFTPYLPFVLGCAILMRSWQAAAVALASVAIMGGVLGGSPALDAPCFVTSAAMFIASSAVMIG